LELANGCLCCSIKDSGVAAIEKLMLRKGAFDYILLETTGLADPGTSPILALNVALNCMPRPNCIDILAQ
jgi:G3E family GTPase